ncbi:RidA family protein [Rhizosaccharibacter radicis]|uniref:RidA family protein n=1 Tax=Rhizosaccharibacter radicis TaxID=2782605 RepID=A0ABT1VWV3_9PROT|nr:RidA family protein [Acetobacteraceae bacterium KSS12]
MAFLDTIGHDRARRFTALVGLGLIAAAAFLTAPAGAQENAVVRHPAEKFPIATAVEVPPGYTTLYLSGMGADVADKNAKPMTLAAYGDTETQVRSALGKIKAQLAALHATPGDIVNMHVFMVADPKTGKMDFPGLMKAYKEMFGTTAQPDLPTRSAFQVAALANPGWLVEIEVIAVRK